MKNDTNSTQAKENESSGNPDARRTGVSASAAKAPVGMTVEQTAEIAALNQLHDEISQTSRMTTQKAIDLGGRLHDLRRSLGHGNWLPFVNAHLSFTSKTAERYMSVYKHRKALTAKFDKLSDFALTDAYGFIAGTKQSDSGGQEVPAQKEVQPEADTNAVIKELGRSVREQLKPLSAEKIIQFKEDLLSFMKSWLERQVGGSENATELTLLPSPVIAEEIRESQGLTPEAGPSDLRSPVLAEGVGVAA